MLNRNNLFTGIVMGFILPFLVFLLLYNLFNLLEKFGAASTQGLSANFRERTIAIISIAVNLIPLNTFKKRHWEDAMRGIVIATAVLAVAWVIRYGLKLL